MGGCELTRPHEPKETQCARRPQHNSLVVGRIGGPLAKEQVQCPNRDRKSPRSGEAWTALLARSVVGLGWSRQGLCPLLQSG